MAEQQELFKTLQQDPSNVSPRRRSGLAPRRTVTWSIEQGLFVLSIAILSVCGAYSIGLERGRAPESQHLPQPMEEAVTTGPTMSERVATQLQQSPTAVPNTKTTQSQSEDEKRYTVQVVTYRKSGLAEGEMKFLSGRGFEPFVIPSGEYYQICVGQFGDRHQAVLALTTLQQRYRDAFIRRR